MLKVASRALGMGPHHAMQVAERLYLSGFISYPRTESTAYPKSFDLRSTVASQSKNSLWGEFATGLLREGLNRPRKGVDVGDHPPITPITADTGGTLTGDAQRLYSMICRHFLASVSPDAEFESTTVQ
jgi:DNA topoisomerase III